VNKQQQKSLLHFVIEMACYKVLPTAVQFMVKKKHTDKKYQQRILQNDLKTSLNCWQRWASV